MNPVVFTGDTHSAVTIPLSAFVERNLCHLTIPIDTKMVSAHLISDSTVVASAGSLTCQLWYAYPDSTTFSDAVVTLEPSSSFAPVDLCPDNAGKGWIMPEGSVMCVRFRGVTAGNSVKNPKLCVVGSLDSETIRSVEMG